VIILFVKILKKHKTNYVNCLYLDNYAAEVLTYNISQISKKIISLIKKNVYVIFVFSETEDIIPLATSFISEKPTLK